MPEQTTTKQLKGKIIIKGTIKVRSGLAIGGNKSGIDIGTLDNPVIKIYRDNKYEPYIPGSSLKGKLRALLAKAAGTENIKADKELIKNSKSKYRHLATVFGYPPDKTDTTGGEALLKVRDSFMLDKEKEVTEEKMENSIHRITGVANPRPLERVLPGVKFQLDLCLDVYDETAALEHLQLLDLAFELLRQDYLGSGGSRGNGRVAIPKPDFTYFRINHDEQKLEKALSEAIQFSFTNPTEDEG